MKGLPMGSSLSAILAILFMDNIEKRALQHLGSIKIFKRYVDDCFILTDRKETALNFQTILNAQHPNIKFEIELRNEDSRLSLLDFTISINDEVSFDFYKKKLESTIENEAFRDQE